MKTITELRQEIVNRSLQAFHEGLFSGTSGNMSCYLREEDLMLITPTSVRYDVMRAEDIVALRLDGTVVEGHLKPSSEWRMHTAVYENCPDVNAVFHTHSPYATAFAVNHQTIPAVLIEALVFLGGDIRCADYATPGTKEVGLERAPRARGPQGLHAREPRCARRGRRPRAGVSQRRVYRGCGEDLRHRPLCRHTGGAEKSIKSRRAVPFGTALPTVCRRGEGSRPFAFLGQRCADAVARCWLRAQAPDFSLLPRLSPAARNSGITGGRAAR